MTTIKDDINAAANALITQAQAKNITLATAESCTGGLIGGALTAISGASRVFMGGIIAYDNAVKQELLHVPAELITNQGAVSRDVAEAMARGAVNALNVDMAVSVTGIAGPGGGTAKKPVGTVWIGTAQRGPANIVIVQAKLFQFGPIGRDNIREHSCLEALKLLQNITE